MRNLFLAILIIGLFSSFGPPNCNLYKKDKNCFEACLEAEKAITFNQGSRQSQIHFDQSIAMCPSFDYSYYEKAVPYAKRGLIREWKVMIDHAIAINPKEYLGIRGWYHYFFMHNYKACIADIEALDSISKYDIGYTGDATYHLNVLKALAWKGLHEYSKALDIMKEQLEKEDHSEGLYDHLNLGVLYSDNAKLDLALESFDRQIKSNDISDAHFHKAKVLQRLSKLDQAKSSILTALDRYENGRIVRNSYRQLPDQIYRSDIINLMNELGMMEL